MKKIKRKVLKDLQKRVAFNSKELSKKERLIIRKAEILRGTEGWRDVLEEINNFGGNGSITKIRNLCKHTGRTRGILVSYGLSRMEWRRLADKGEIPGIRRASW